jgi:hypothetical protein
MLRSLMSVMKRLFQGWRGKGAVVQGVADDGRVLRSSGRGDGLGGMTVRLL